MTEGQGKVELEKVHELEEILVLINKIFVILKGRDIQDESRKHRRVLDG
jgi:hypothetical protein